MATKNRGLGKGLGSLLGDVADINLDRTPMKKEEAPAQAEFYVKTRLVEPNREQPRKDFDEASLEELAESIRIHGIIQPLIVTKEGERYRIVAGERRWRAAKLAGLKEIPVIIRDYTEETVAEVALIENIQRKDLNPIEEAKAYKKLLEEYKMTQEVLSERISKSRTVITNAMRLLKLPQGVQDLLSTGKLSTGHAKTILGLEDPEKQTEVAEKVISDNLSVRQTEALIKSLLKEKKAPVKKALRNQVAYDEARQSLEDCLATKVVINRKSETAGKIEITYNSLEDFERIVGHIR